MSGLEGNSIFQKVIHKEHKKTRPSLPAGISALKKQAPL
jgi:hypothetical protein